MSNKLTPEQEIQKQALVAYLRKAADEMDALAEKFAALERGETPVDNKDFDA